MDRPKSREGLGHKVLPILVPLEGWVHTVTTCAGSMYSHKEWTDSKGSTTAQVPPEGWVHRYSLILDLLKGLLHRPASVEGASIPVWVHSSVESVGPESVESWTKPGSTGGVGSTGGLGPEVHTGPGSAAGLGVHAALVPFQEGLGAGPHQTCIRGDVPGSTDQYQSWIRCRVVSTGPHQRGIRSRENSRPTRTPTVIDRRLKLSVNWREMKLSITAWAR